MKKQPTKHRIYVCHTFYHVYVAFLKEMYLPEACAGQATLVLSHMSIDFGNLKERLEALHFFEEIIDFDEKNETFFPELAVYRKPSSNPIRALYNRMRFTSQLAKKLEPFVPVNFKEYEEIYVFCDSDPIGYYLNKNHIYYHAVEDGLNCLWFFDTARYDNRGLFWLKAFLSKYCNLLFIQNGYGKYCLDMEVNDISKIKYPFKGYRELPREQLVEHLTKSDKEILLRAFVQDLPRLKAAMEKNGQSVLILTEPLCNLEVRERIFKDIVKQYGEGKTVIIKPHPRDALDYRRIFPEHIIIDAAVPMEMLNFLENCQVDLAISVLTNTGGIRFAKEVKMLGPDFLDAYEDPSIHRQNEQI